METVSNSQPGVVEIDKRIEKARQQERKTLDKMAKAGAKHRAAYETWLADSLAAEEAGKEPKPQPTPPDEQIRTLVLGRIRAEIERDLKERRRAIVSAADAIYEEVENEAAQILKAAAKPLKDLRDAVSELRGLVSALDDVADARQSLDSLQRTNQTRPPRVDLETLINAVDRGVETLFVGRENQRPRDMPRALGIQPGSTLADSAAESSHPDPPSAGPQIRIRHLRTSTGAEL